MPRVARIVRPIAVPFYDTVTIPYRYNPKNFIRNLQPAGKLTKQGVRDLNGPEQNGTGYNGRRTSSCSHYRSPQSTPTHITERMLADATVPGGLRRGYMVTCSLCGVELHEREDD